MNCQDCELYFRCGGHDVCPYESDVEPIKELNIEMLCEITGADSQVVCNLIDAEFFGGLYDNGLFEYHAIDVLNDYLDG